MSVSPNTFSNHDLFPMPNAFTKSKGASLCSVVIHLPGIMKESKC